MTGFIYNVSEHKNAYNFHKDKKSNLNGFDAQLLAERTTEEKLKQYHEIAQKNRPNFYKNFTEEKDISFVNELSLPVEDDQAINTFKFIKNFKQETGAEGDAFRTILNELKKKNVKKSSDVWKQLNIYKKNYKIAETIDKDAGTDPGTTVGYIDSMRFHKASDEAIEKVFDAAATAAATAAAGIDKKEQARAGQNVLAKFATHYKDAVAIDIAAGTDPDTTAEHINSMLINKASDEALDKIFVVANVAAKNYDEDEEQKAKAKQNVFEIFAERYKDAGAIDKDAGTDPGTTAEHINNMLANNASIEVLDKVFVAAADAAYAAYVAVGVGRKGQARAGQNVLEKFAEHYINAKIADDTNKNTEATDALNGILTESTDIGNTDKQLQELENSVLTPDSLATILVNIYDAVSSSENKEDDIQEEFNFYLESYKIAEEIDSNYGTSNTEYIDSILANKASTEALNKVFGFANVAAADDNDKDKDKEQQAKAMQNILEIFAEHYIKAKAEDDENNNNEATDALNNILKESDNIKDIAEKLQEPKLNVGSFEDIKETDEKQRPQDQDQEEQKLHEKSSEGDYEDDKEVGGASQGTKFTETLNSILKKFTGKGDTSNKKPQGLQQKSKTVEIPADIDDDVSSSKKTKEGEQKEFERLLENHEIPAKNEKGGEEKEKQVSHETSKKPQLKLKNEINEDTREGLNPYSEEFDPEEISLDTEGIDADDEISDDDTITTEDIEEIFSTVDNGKGGEEQDQEEQKLHEKSSEGDYEDDKEVGGASQGTKFTETLNSILKRFTGKGDTSNKNPQKLQQKLKNERNEDIRKELNHYSEEFDSKDERIDTANTAAKNEKDKKEQTQAKQESSEPTVSKTSPVTTGAASPKSTATSSLPTTAVYKKAKKDILREAELTDNEIEALRNLEIVEKNEKNKEGRDIDEILEQLKINREDKKQIKAQLVNMDIPSALLFLQEMITDYNTKSNKFNKNIKEEIYCENFSVDDIKKIKEQLNNQEVKPGELWKKGSSGRNGINSDTNSLINRAKKYADEFSGNLFNLDESVSKFRLNRKINKLRKKENRFNKNVQTINGFVNTHYDRAKYAANFLDQLEYLQERLDSSDNRQQRAICKKQIRQLLSQQHNFSKSKNKYGKRVLAKTLLATVGVVALVGLGFAFLNPAVVIGWKIAAGTFAGITALANIGYYLNINISTNTKINYYKDLAEKTLDKSNDVLRVAVGKEVLRRNEATEEIDELRKEIGKDKTKTPEQIEKEVERKIKINSNGIAIKKVESNDETIKSKKLRKINNNWWTRTFNDGELTAEDSKSAIAVHAEKHLEDTAELKKGILETLGQLSVNPNGFSTATAKTNKPKRYMDNDMLDGIF